MFVEAVSGLNGTSENTSKKKPIFFGFQVWDLNIWDIFYKSQKLQIMANLSSNNSLDLYLPKSLGPLKKKIRWQKRLKISPDKLCN